MNGPSGNENFQPMVPGDGGGYLRPPMGFAFDGGFNGGVRVEDTRQIVERRGGFRPSGPPVKFPSPEGRFISDSDYSVRLPPPPPLPLPPLVQQRLSGQKRGLPLSDHGSFTGIDASSDRSSVVKLFVGSVPRTAIEEEVRPFFEQHGNVLEVALIKDKKTGQQQGCCFVKYTTSEDADRAIRELHNQITLPGGTGPVQVRYADGERERIGALEFKLFVGSLNKQATEKEVEEIFLQFGRVEDVYLMRDEHKQSRGCGFVKYSSKETAMAAINGLNGTYIMRGCNQPFIVRFADPKRPKPGESRDVAPPAGPGSGPRFQATGVSGPGSRPRFQASGVSRPGSGPQFQASGVSGPGVPPLNPLPVSGVSSSATSQQQIRATGQQISPFQKSLPSPQNIFLRPQTNFPGAQASSQNPYGYRPTSQLLSQQNATPATAPQTHLNINIRSTPASSATNQFPPRAQQQPLQNMQHPPSQLAQLLSQQTQTLQATFQSSQQAFSQLQQELQSRQQPNQNLSVAQNGQAGKQQWTGSAIPTVVSTTSSTPVGDVLSATSVVNQNVVSVQCNWTEHMSPDGFKYYYNGLTGESKWEKPEEMIVFERQQQHQQKPTIQQPQAQLQQSMPSQPMQQQPQAQLQQSMPSQPIQQQPQQVHQQYHGHQQLQQPFYPSLEYGHTHVTSMNDPSRAQQTTVSLFLGTHVEK
ncbi:rna binding abscisic acid binding protein [Arabis alpina]|uniref:Flowering time control protein FCA n=1 Tax=Arabis alpina TaxID=50452 RepID=A0A087H1X0_ARAAL|nr:rna binding abscisic acid binding protein [Arabis alpina]